MKKTLAVNPNHTEPIASTELAAFIVLLFRVHNDQTKPESTFEDQLTAVRDRIPDTLKPLQDRVTLLKQLNADAEVGPKIKAAHDALFNLFMAIHETGDWGGCKTVDMQQLLGIARLPPPHVVVEKARPS